MGDLFLVAALFFLELLRNRPGRFATVPVQENVQRKKELDAVSIVLSLPTLEIKLTKAANSKIC